MYSNNPQGDASTAGKRGPGTSTCVVQDCMDMDAPDEEGNTGLIFLKLRNREFGLYCVPGQVARIYPANAYSPLWTQAALEWTLWQIHSSRYYLPGSQAACFDCQQPHPLQQLGCYVFFSDQFKQ